MAGLRDGRAGLNPRAAHTAQPGAANKEKPLTSVSDRRGKRSAQAQGMDAGRPKPMATKEPVGFGSRQPGPPSGGCAPPFHLFLGFPVNHELLSNYYIVAVRGPFIDQIQKRDRDDAVLIAAIKRRCPLFAIISQAQVDNDVGIKAQDKGFERRASYNVIQPEPANKEPLAPLVAHGI